MGNRTQSHGRSGVHCWRVSWCGATSLCLSCSWLTRAVGYSAEAPVEGSGDLADDGAQARLLSRVSGSLPAPPPALLRTRKVLCSLCVCKRAQACTHTCCSFSLETARLFNGQKAKERRSKGSDDFCIWFPDVLGKVVKQTWQWLKSVKTQVHQTPQKQRERALVSAHGPARF